MLLMLPKTRWAFKAILYKIFTSGGESSACLQEDPYVIFISVPDKCAAQRLL
jgi:hypothetical protein